MKFKSAQFDEQMQLADRMKTVIDEFSANRTDTHGFYKLDSFLGLIEDRGSGMKQQLDRALSNIIQRLHHSNTEVWGAIRLIIKAAGTDLPETSLSIIKKLDTKADPFELKARYEAYCAYTAAGGRLTRPQLDEETSLKEKLTAQWSDLVLSAYRGSPESVVRLIEDLLNDASLEFTWRDLIQRLEFYYDWLGPEDFNKCMRRIVPSVSELEGRLYLVREIKELYGVIIPLSYHEHPASEEVLSDAMKNAIRNEIKKLMTELEAKVSFAEAAHNSTSQRVIPMGRPRGTAKTNTNTNTNTPGA